MVNELRGATGAGLLDCKKALTEANGNIAQATLVAHPGICSIHPTTGAHEWFDFPDLLTTNIVFGGADMMDAWVCLSTTGKLAKCRWPRPGLKLAYYA